MISDQEKCPRCGCSLKNIPERVCPSCALACVLELDDQDSSGLGHVKYFGKYELLEEIARGGMGIVYKARQDSLRRIVALKLIYPAALDTEQMLRRFKAEAELAASLEHPGIVPIHEIGEHEGQPYFTMGFVEGPALSARTAEGPMPQREAATLLSRIARIVDFAHQRGVLHRDLKPGNILLDSEGRPHLADFGLAKLANNQSSITAPEALLGTPAYMAPEQALDARRATILSDVYSLGAVLYHCLTGAPPFAGQSALEVARQVCDCEPKRPSTLVPALDRDLELITMKCLGKEPFSRYSSARELASDLDRWLDGEPILARPATALEAAWKWAARNPVLSALAGAAALILLAGALGVGLQWRRAERALRASQERFYAASIKLAQEAINEQDRGRAVRLLESQIPEPGAPDLRGFEWRYLWSLTQGNEDRLISAERSFLMCLAFSPDGRYLAMEDEVVDLKTGAHKRLAAEHDSFCSVVFDSSGDSVVLAGNGEVKRIRIADASVLWRQPLEQAFLANFLGDGSTLVATYNITLGHVAGGRACILSATNGAILRALEGASGRALAVSGDRSRFATGSRDGAVQIWNARSGILEQTLTNALGVTALAFSPDGARLVAGCWDGFLQEWYLPRGTLLRQDKLHRSHVWGIAIGPEGTIYTASNDHTCRAWTRGLKPARNFTGHLSGVPGLALSHDSAKLATVSGEQVRIWSIAANAAPDPKFESIPFRWAPALFSFGDHYVVQSARGPSLVESSTGREIRNFGEEAIAFDTIAPDTLLLQTRPGSNPVATWNFRTGARTNLHLDRIDPNPRSLRALSGGRIMTVSTNAHIWAASSGKLLQEFIACKGLAFGWDISPDRETLVVGHQTREGGAANLISMRDYSIKASIATSAVVEAVAFNEPGTLVALASWDHSVYLCSLPGLKLIRNIQGHLGAIYHAAFTRDNALLTASEDGSTVLWDLRTGLEMMRFPYDACYAVKDMWVLGRKGFGNEPMTLELLKAPRVEMRTTSTP